VGGCVGVVREVGDRGRRCPQAVPRIYSATHQTRNECVDRDARRLYGKGLQETHMRNA
jgi:hypothetical protein